MHRTTHNIIDHIYIPGGRRRTSECQKIKGEASIEIREEFNFIAKKKKMQRLGFAFFVTTGDELMHKLKLQV